MTSLCLQILALQLNTGRPFDKYPLVYLSNFETEQLDTTVVKFWFNNKQQGEGSVTQFGHSFRELNNNVS